MSSFSKTLLWPLTSLLKTKCPYQHLALEDSLLHRSSDYFYPLCLIYKNAPNVSLGRSQCVWTEVHLPTLLTHEEITLSRRFSGGGTVFQDEETLNFSFISSHKEHNPQQNLFFLQSFLEFCGISDLEQTSRFDLLWQGKKITGSAFRKTKENTLHHFTLLWKTNLSLLRKLLFFSQSAIGLGTLSKRQEVANIGESYQIENFNLSSDELIKRLIEFHSLSLISCENLYNSVSWEHIFEKYSSLEWIWHNSRGFVIPSSLGNLTLLLSPNPLGPKKIKEYPDKDFSFFKQVILEKNPHLELLFS